MSVKIIDFIKIMEKAAPVSLKESYDNVGLMVGDSGKELKRVLMALDCTEAVIEEAVSIEADLILTHHPLLFKKPSSITTDTLQGRKIINLITNNISLYSSHTNLDSVHKGMNDTLMEILNIKENSILEPAEDSPVKESGIGRIGRIDGCTLEDLINEIKSKLRINNLRYTGKLETKISRIAVINGSGGNYFPLAFKNGAQCIITGDTTYHFASDFAELGCSIIDVGHFPSEWITFLRVMKRIIKENSTELNNVEFIQSKVSEDPYKYI